MERDMESGALIFWSGSKDEYQKAEEKDRTGQGRYSQVEGIC